MANLLPAEKLRQDFWAAYYNNSVAPVTTPFNLTEKQYEELAKQAAQLFISFNTTGRQP